MSPLDKEAKFVTFFGKVSNGSTQTFAIASLVTSVKVNFIIRIYIVEENSKFQYLWAKFEGGLYFMVRNMQNFNAVYC